MGKAANGADNKLASLAGFSVIPIKKESNPIPKLPRDLPKHRSHPQQALKVLEQHLLSKPQETPEAQAYLFLAVNFCVVCACSWLWVKECRKMHSDVIP